jgi:hypothetical protein
VGSDFDDERVFDGRVETPPDGVKKKGRRAATLHALERT